MYTVRGKIKMNVVFVSNVIYRVGLRLYSELY
jgi:hypothetical protein